MDELLSKYSKKQPNCNIIVSTCETPIGKIIAGADNSYLYFVSFENSSKLDSILNFLSNELTCVFIDGENSILRSFKQELEDYFSGNLTKFNSPIKTFGSEFQKVSRYIIACSHLPL